MIDHKRGLLEIKGSKIAGVLAHIRPSREWLARIPDDASSNGDGLGALSLDLGDGARVGRKRIDTALNRLGSAVELHILRGRVLRSRWGGGVVSGERVGPVNNGRSFRAAHATLANREEG